MVKFELNSLLKNYTALFFGLVFPVVLAGLIIIAVTKNMPDMIAIEAKKSIVLTISIISPISIFLIGLSSVFAKDLEEGVYDRLELFSINHLAMAKYKFLIFYLFWFLCNAIYFTICVKVYGVNLALIPILKHIGYVSIVSLTMFLISYAICLFTKKFTTSFGITMGMYFGIMILGGMMGIQVEDLPGGVRTVAKIIPTSHFSSIDYLEEIAVGGGLSYTFLQNLIVFLMMAIILFAISIYKSKRISN